jgi:hypothetical protein
MEAHALEGMRDRVRELSVDDEEIVAAGHACSVVLTRRGNSSSGTNHLGDSDYRKRSRAVARATA